MSISVSANPLDSPRNHWAGAYSVHLLTDIGLGAVDATGTGVRLSLLAFLSLWFAPCPALLRGALGLLLSACTSELGVMSKQEACPTPAEELTGGAMS